MNKKKLKVKVTSEQQEEIKRIKEQIAMRKKEEPKKLSEHLQAFNDAVIAIIMTIIVLEIKPPLHEVHYEKFISDVFIFLIAFFILADFWYDLHKMFVRVIFRPNKATAVFDIFLLADLALIPVMTKWIMGEDSEFAVINFGVIYLIAQILKIFIQYFGATTTMNNSDFGKAFLTRGAILRAAFVLLLNVILIGLAFFAPKIAMILYITIPIVSFFFTPENSKLK